MASETPKTPVMLRQEWIIEKKAAINPAFSQPAFRKDLKGIRRSLHAVQFQFGRHMAQDTRPVMPSRQRSYKRFTRLLQGQHDIPAWLAESIRLLYPDGRFSQRMQHNLREAGWNTEKVTDPRLSIVERRLEGRGLGRVPEVSTVLHAGLNLESAGNGSSVGDPDVMCSKQDNKTNESQPEPARIPYPITTPSLRPPLLLTSARLEKKIATPNRKVLLGMSTEFKGPLRRTKVEEEIKAERGIDNVLAIPYMPSAAGPQPPSSGVKEEVKRETKIFKTEVGIKRLLPPSPYNANIPHLPDQRVAPTSHLAASRYIGAAVIRRAPSINPKEDLKIQTRVAPPNPEEAVLARIKRQKDTLEQLRRRRLLRKCGKDTDESIDLIAESLSKTYAKANQIQKSSSPEVKTSTDRRENPVERAVKRGEDRNANM